MERLVAIAALCCLLPACGGASYSANDLVRSRLEIRARIVAAGGCKANRLPYEVAQYCARDAFGDPMGSRGGSEN
jgi:hypothetical protein